MRPLDYRFCWWPKQAFVILTLLWRALHHFFLRPNFMTNITHVHHITTFTIYSFKHLLYLHCYENSYHFFLRPNLMTNIDEVNQSTHSNICYTYTVKYRSVDTYIRSVYRLVVCCVQTYTGIGSWWNDWDYSNQVFSIGKCIVITPLETCGGWSS